MTRLTFKFISALAAVLAMTGAAVGQSLPKEGLLIVVPITSIDGKPTHEVRKALDTIAAVVRKQPGLIEEFILESVNQGAKPSHLHVMRWKDRKSWEGTFADPEFHKAQTLNKGLFTVDTVGMYAPVRK